MKHEQYEGYALGGVSGVPSHYLYRNNLGQLWIVLGCLWLRVDALRPGTDGYGIQRAEWRDHEGNFVGYVMLADLPAVIERSRNAPPAAQTLLQLRRAA